MKYYGLDLYPYYISVCLATIGVCVFRCADFGWRTFLCLEEKKCQGDSPLY